MELLPRRLPRAIPAKLLALALVAAGVSDRAVSERPIRVSIQLPTAEQAVFGEVRFEVAVEANEPIVRVDFFVDGTLAASDQQPPYRVQVDAGQHNAAKRFTAVAHGRSGRTGADEVMTPKIAVDLEMDLALQQLYVTVTRSEEAVLDLDRDAFRIFDSGVEQRLVTFERGGVPLAVVVLLDASESMMGDRLPSAIEAVRQFLAGLGPLDEAMVLVFSDRALYTTAFRPGSTALELPPDLTPGGGTALNDHLYGALRFLDTRLSRPVVLLLSDGADTLSFLHIDEVRWKLQRSDAILYRVRSRAGGAEPTAFATSWRSFPQNHAEIEGLERALLESGGRVYHVPESKLDEAVQSLIEELRQQYVLGYYPSTRSADGGWRSVRVEVAVPDVEVRTRSGYIDRQSR